VLRALGRVIRDPSVLLSPPKDADGDNQHVIARLESFSDIVIGFSLAQTAINLVVTSSVEYFFSHPIGIVAYLITFFLVARMWWTHSQIMHRFFEPNPLMIGLNFVALAALGLMVFGLQLWLHRGGDIAGQILAVKFYFLCFSLTIGTLAGMRTLGLHLRWSHLDPKQRRSAMGRSAATFVMCFALVVGVFSPTTYSFFGASSAPVPANLLYALLGGSIGGRLTNELLLRSNWGAATHA
jgi:uncharacterized membrane protein